MYDGAPFVDEWKPLPPRLHDLRTLERHVTVAGDVAVAVREVTEQEVRPVRKDHGIRPLPDLRTETPGGLDSDADVVDPDAAHHPRRPGGRSRPTPVGWEPDCPPKTSGSSQPRSRDGPGAHRPCGI